MKDINILIVPDVHGRTFWKLPVENTLKNTNAKIIFLGDYLDPYPYEFEDPMDGTVTVDYIRESITLFQEIIELKKQYPDRITLLLGNHDFGYIWPNICSCRKDRANAEKIGKLFSENRLLFLLADELTVGDKHFIFSHAGIGDKYLNICFGEIANENNAVNLFNNAWEVQSYGIMDSLGYYDKYRGWSGYPYPSIVWADAQGWIDGLQNGIGISIVGHSQVEEAINYKDKYYFLDCHKCSYLDNMGNVLDYDTDSPIKKLKI